jgi:peptidoglycan/LPS O-acetylase OafA/YrhL
VSATVRGSLDVSDRAARRAEPDVREQRVAEPAPRRAGPRRIAEIDGLRAVALTLVVAFHLFGRGRVSGGVDVFLFVSGVVLAMSLGASAARGEGAALLRRWGRTFARLAPPAAVVLLAVVAMSSTVLSPWFRDQTLIEVVSAAAYVENWQLIASQLAYGAAGPSTSPVQHFWSLSVQGQLLILVPLAAAGVLALRRSSGSLWVLAAVATAASLAYATISGQADQAVAYFDTFARFWEFGLGLLVGCVIRRGIALPAVSGAVFGWLGLGAVLTSGLFIDGAQAYPGPAALVPVGGAALVVLSIRSDGFGPGVLLRSRSLARFSPISYSLYLWHWPVLIGFLAIAQREDGIIGWRGALVVLAVSVGLATATWWALERPLALFLAGAGRRAHAVTALTSVLLVICMAVGGLVASRPPAGVGPAGAGVLAAECLGAAALDPLRPECEGVADLSVPPVPAYGSLRSDDDNRQECWASKKGLEEAMCSLGPAEGYTRHLLAVGDSHNNVLVGVYEAIAKDRGWRIDVAGRPQCHWTRAARTQSIPANVAGCAEWNAFIDGYVAATDLDGIIVTNSSRAEYTLQPGDSLVRVRAQGFAAAWSARPDPSTPIFAIRDNPIFPIASLGCILDLGRVRSGECSSAREDALLDDGLADAVALDAHAHLIDLTDYMCEPARCGLVVGGVVVSRDGSHLTATFAHTLTPYLEAAISGVLDE